MTRLVYKNKAWDAKISEVMDRYVISNKYPKDVNPKVVRTILWRTLCNASKFSEGQQFVRSNTAQILLAAIETLFLIPVFLVTFFLQDHLLRGVTFGTVKR